MVQKSPGLEVWRVGDPDAPSLSATDAEILLWCDTHDFILVTNNRVSMPRHLEDHINAGRHIPGIFVVNPTARMTDVVAELLLICVASLPGEFVDRIVHIPIH